MSREIPYINVGILFEPEISFILHGEYTCCGKTYSGEQHVQFAAGQIDWDGRTSSQFVFEPVDEETCFFELSNVTIGIDFHWERKETQRFQGGLRFIIENKKLTAINFIKVEKYLLSVISSEMSATASLEMLKAHAVISRGWLLAQMQKQKEAKGANYSSFVETKEEIIRWYDREDHLNFDVCADDHCQRYQGINRVINETVRRAVDETFGQALCFDGKICDTRFSKCCGGVYEEFQNCWEDVRHPYLVKQRDSKVATYIPDLTNEKEAGKWIRTSPESFCNTQNKQILGQVLTNYDQETTDFFRWKVTYSQEELSKLVYERTGMDFGTILDLIPMQRGTSGRIVKLKVVGTKMSKIIGKELLIRRILSTSHLYSSAFVVDKKEDTFILTGAGWGHGVGLCQIGAAVMSEQGYTYNEILLHYYVGATIEKLY